MTTSDRLAALHTKMLAGRPDDAWLVSQCCSAPPLGELDLDNTGRCSQCREMALFKTRTQWEELT